MGLSCLFLSPAKAFFLGSDKFTDEEYKKAGITAKHHTLLLDEYIFKKGGFSISQSTAESLTSLYQTTFDTDDKSKENELDKVYVMVAQHIIKLFKDKDSEINRLSYQVSRLSAENTSLRLKLIEKNRPNKTSHT